jgi:peptidyl-prolyl cis-trans isomerase SurA
MPHRPVRLLLCLSLVLAPGGLPAAELAFGPDQLSTGSGLDVIVAVVDDDVITQAELNDRTRLFEQRLRRTKAVPPPGVLEQQMLERLIMAKLQLRAAERSGIVVDDPTLNAELENLARRQNLSLGELRQQVERDGVSFAEFREEVRQEILFSRLRQRMIDSRIQISDQEVDNALAVAADASADPARAPANGADGAHVSYRVGQILIATPENASAAQIEAARRQAEQVLEQVRRGGNFAALAARYSADPQARKGGELGWRTAAELPSLFAPVVPRLQPGQAGELIQSPSGFHIVKLLDVKGRPRSAAAPVSRPPPAAAADLTQVRVRHILIKTGERVSDEEARLRLQRLYERLQHGEDFAELARSHSNDARSSVKGGELGWIGVNDLGPEFGAIVNQLQPGQYSAPVKTSFGWDIVQVLERRQAPVGGQADRARVREALFRRRVEEEHLLWLRQLRDEAYVEIRLPGARETAQTPTAKP